MDELEGKLCHDVMVNRCLRAFDELKDKAERTNNVAVLQNIKIEADALKVNLLTEIARKEAEMTPRDAPDPADPEQQDTPVVPQPKPKKNKIVSIKSVTSAATWQLETPEDVQKYITALQNKLNGMLQENTILHIEF